MKARQSNHSWKKIAQEAVVYSVLRKQNNVFVKCYSPVFGKLELTGSDIDIQRGDILLLERVEKGYRIIVNKTAEQIVQVGLYKIFDAYGLNSRQQEMIKKIVSERQK